MKPYPLVHYLITFLFLFSTVVTASNNLPAPVETWEQPTPVFDHKFDWIRLNSGEWLKGNIISMYDDELEFDSVKFDQRSFDWDDIEELRSRFDQSIRFKDGRVIEGFIVVKNGELSILSGGKEQKYPLTELLNITSSSENRLGLWDGNFSLGANFLKGNVGQKDYTINSKIQRRTTLSRLKFDYIYNYSEVAGDEGQGSTVTANSSRFTGSYDWLYSTKIFFRVLDMEYFQDELQNIESRKTYGLALGYHAVDNKKMLWDFTAGPSYQQTAYIDAIGNDIEKSAVISLSTLFEYELTGQIDYIFDYQLQFVSKESGSRLHNLKTGFSFDLIYNIDIDISMYIDRIAEPVPTATGDTPQENDYRTVVAFSYYF